MAISIEQAQKDQFQNSTREELIGYCDQLDLKADRRSPKAMVAALCEELGVALPGHSQVTHNVRKAIKAKGSVLPPYNLTPNGVWGGRRHRIVLHRPDGVKIEGGKVFGWNGKPYAIAYDEVTNIPEPFLNALKETISPRTRSIDVPLGDGTVERHIEIVQGGQTYRYDYRGVDPETANRAGSLSEYYREKGPEFFEALTKADMREICKLCDINLRDEERQLKDETRLREDLMIFFFGYAQVEMEAA
jgi:hypothetical protein